MRLSHAEAQALVSARLDGPLDRVAERELNAHLATCDSCRAFNSSATQLARSLQAIPYLPPSPAVTRAVLDHVSAPRSGWSVLVGGLPERALPVATVIAAAVIIVFVGAFAIFQSLGNDDPETIPAKTETTLAQQPNSTEAALATTAVETETAVQTQANAPTEESASGEQTEVPSTEAAATEEQTRLSATDTAENGATEEAAQTTEPAATDEAFRSLQSPTEEPTAADVETPPAATVTVDEQPTETPAVEVTQEPELEPTTEDDSNFTLIGPSGNASATDESSPEDPTEQPAVTQEPATETPEPTATAQPTLEPTPEPTATLEPTLEPTVEPSATLEPTAEPTPEPTATQEPTPEPTLEPTATTEPEPSPTNEPDVPVIESRDQTPITGERTEPDVTQESVTTEVTIAPAGDGTQDGSDQVIEPSEGSLADSGNDSAATAESGVPDGGEATGDGNGPSNDGQQGVGAAEETLASAPTYLNLNDVPGDSARRLGLDANGQLIFSPNPGRISLTEGGVTLSGAEGGSGQFVQACDGSGVCVDVSSGSQGDGFTIDTPIGWLNGEIVYERLNGDRFPVEFRMVAIDVATGAIGEDRLLGGGDGGWETLVRPYPVGNGLLVPAQAAWLYVTAESVSAIDGNPVGESMTLYRVTPSTGTVSYVSGGEIILATVDAPGTAIARIPFSGSDYDFSPSSDQVAVIYGDGIEIWDASGNLVTTIPNPEGISVGGIAWLNQGIVFVDYTNGVVRILEP